MKINQSIKNSLFNDALFSLPAFINLNFDTYDKEKSWKIKVCEERGICDITRLLRTITQDFQEFFILCLE